MDAFAVERYRYLLAAIGIAMLVATIAGAWLARRPAPAELADDDPALSASRITILPHIMLLLVATAAGTGLVLLLPAAFILRFFPGWPVAILVIAALTLLTAPLVYAWRARPF